MSIKYIGMDFEASGSEPWTKHVPIQIGMAITLEGLDSTFESLIGGWQFDNYNDPANSYEWSEEAYGVHKIDKDDLKGAPPVWAVDIEAAAWLLDKVGHKGRMTNITVGWNVAGYDRQFVTRWMPNLNRLLSYRTLDLNALLFMRAGSDEAAYVGWKKRAKKYADEKLAHLVSSRHNAAYDARAALYEKDWLLNSGLDVRDIAERDA